VRILRVETKNIQQHKPKKKKKKCGNNKMETRECTYVHMIKSKELHYALISLDIFTIH